MMNCIKSSVVLLLVTGVLTTVARAQDRQATSDTETGTERVGSDADFHLLAQKPKVRYELQPGEDPQNKLGLPFLKHLAADQRNFWTSPMRLQRNDVRRTLPFSLFTGTLIASDSWLSKQIPNTSQQGSSQHISQFATYSLVGAAGASFLWGHMTRNDHLRETGLLSSEAILNSTAATFILKGVTQRQRPFVGDGNGGFFRGGGSFPSEHAAIAWSAASVIAHEYPGPLTKFLAYGLATAVTVTRVTSKEHFASDAFIGSALGWFIGMQVYRAHHNPELGGGAWENFLESNTEKGARDPANMGSPDVPIDSWVYPLFDRLAALGYVQSAYVGMRPWTRMECARLLEEAAGHLRYEGEVNGEAQQLYDTLAGEFVDESSRLNGAANLGVSLDSVYTRFTGISGTPVRDGYHFGQTLANDYGRPYGEGFNNVTGITAHAVAGPLSLYVQSEYQNAPAVPSDPPAVLEAIAKQDRTLPFSNGTSAISRFRLMSASVAVTFKNIQLSFGKQPLWLGPGDSGPFLMSNNAEPIPMFRISQVSPFRIPGLSRLLGPVRTEFFLGQLDGHRWIFSDDKLYGPNVEPQPYIHGSKIGFKPTANLEFGLGYTVLFGGPGMPFTWHNFLRTFTSFNVAPGSASDPGDRRSTFDFSYRVPRLRKWLTVYADSFVEDEISPLGSTRPSMRMGAHLPQVPKLPKLELRLEGLYTDVPGQKPTGFVYWNGRYLSGYTNDRNLLGSWIGRQGRGGQAWATYWLSPRSNFQLAYRHSEVDRAFLGGGRMNDFAARSEYLLRSDLGISGFLQYEQWRFPILDTNGRSNVSVSVQLAFYPKWRIRK